MKTTNLEGALLDYRVAMALGFKASPDGKYLDAPSYYDEEGSGVRYKSYTLDGWKPSVDWKQGGPIIEREGIAVAPLRDGKTQEVVWFAWHEGKRETWHDESNQQFEEADGYFERSTGWHKPHGSTPLIAAMRAFVASKLDEDEFD